MREGLIRHNPTQGAALPARDERKRIEEDRNELGEGDDVRALSMEQLATLLRSAPTAHRLLFELLAATGLRISEATALRVADLSLDGKRPVVRVRRAWVRGAFKPPKSKYGRREVPIGYELARALKASVGERDARALLFPGPADEPLHASNLRTRDFKPAAEAAGVPWAGFHTLRHTCATRLFAEGRNVKQVQLWLGHHAPSFTLDTYVKCLNDDLGEPLGTPEGGNQVATGPTPEDATRGAQLRAIAA
jgi:integrase